MTLILWLDVIKRVEKNLANLWNWSMKSFDFQFMFVGFNYVSNLIVIYSIIYLYFFGIKCNGFRVQIGEELWSRGFRDWLTMGATCKRPHEKHMLEVQTTQVSKAFREWLETWPTCDLTREMHGQLFMFVSLISLPTLMKL